MADEDYYCDFILNGKVPVHIVSGRPLSPEYPAASGELAV
jgi:hypothetical protein